MPLPARLDIVWLVAKITGWPTLLPNCLPGTIADFGGLSQVVEG